MAVEARNTNLLLPASNQFITNRDQFINGEMDSGGYIMPEIMLSNHYQQHLLSSVYDLPCSAKTSMKADSGLTYNITAPRKRPRDDSINDLNASISVPPHQRNRISGLSDRDVLLKIQQQQSDLDRFIALHTERVRLELEEKKKLQSRMLATAIQEEIAKKLKEKDEEIERMMNLNWALQERVKSLCFENQMWRELAQSNEVTANSLRSNLEQVLVHEQRQEPFHVEDAQSSCGSCDEGGCAVVATAKSGWSEMNGGGGDVASMKCRKCKGRESSVLLLPCRHLCLCTVCGSNLSTCPECNSLVNGSVHVNFS